MGLIRPIERGERGGELEICDRIVSVGFDRPLFPADCALVVAEAEFRRRGYMHPSRRVSVGADSIEALHQREPLFRRSVP